MSFQVTEAFVQQYNANVFHLSQQKGSRLRPFVRQETQVGKSEFFDRIGAVEAVKNVARHGDTPQLDTPHSRRRVTLEDYDWGDLIDKQDKIRMLNDPTSEYAMAAGWAMGRAMDTEIIAAAVGTAYSGETGQTAVVLPAGQWVGAVSAGAISNLNVATLIKVKSKFGVNDVDENEELHICVSQSQIDAMLGQTQVTSSDYNSIKALVEGKVDTFMGFKFHRSQRLLNSGLFTTDTTTHVVTLATGNSNAARQCFAWSKPGVLLSVGAEPFARITERADKRYSTQVYNSMSIGATRMEEAKVVGVLCHE